MLKYLKAIIMVSAIFSLAPPVLADIIGNIIADINSQQYGDNTAIATNESGNNNKVIATIGAVNINLEASSNSRIESTLRLNFNITHQGDNFAEAINRGGSNNDVRATVSALSINVHQGF